MLNLEDCIQGCGFLVLAHARAYTCLLYKVLLFLSFLSDVQPNIVHVRKNFLAHDVVET